MSSEEVSVYRGQRLAALRHIFSLSQATLSERLGVTQSFLSQVEGGSRPVPRDLVVNASTEFSLPLAFFSVQPTPWAVGPVTFRKNSRASVRDEYRVAELYNEAARLFRRVSEDSGYREADLPDPAEYEGDPEQVARAMRSAAGLGPDDPVLNATRSLERFGVGVVDRLDEAGRESGHIGVSRPSRLNRRPLVALAHDVPGAVKRLTLLHELYHLIADRELPAPVTSTRSPEERRAYRFAGAFLLPEQVVRQRVSESLNLHGYLPIKADYGLSVGAILRRALDLGVITPDRYRSLSIQLSSAGWRANEPVEVADEKPLLLGQALRKAFGSQAIAKASHVVGSAPEWIHRWTHTIEDQVDDSLPNVVSIVDRLEKFRP